MNLKTIFILLSVFVLIGCGTDTVTVSGTNSNTESNQNTTSTPTATTSNANAITLSGVISYDAVPFAQGGKSGLDYTNIEKKPVRGAVIEIVNTSNQVLATTTTDQNGAYSTSVEGTQVKVRVLAKLYQSPNTAGASWDFEVRDNTNANSLYAMEGSFASLGTGTTQTRNLHAPSGWGGSSYNSERVAGPFSILDVVYASMQKVVTAQNDAKFPALDIFWSKDNLPSGGNRSLGEIGTSHFDGQSIYLLGKANTDTDEYDTVVVAHEWGHYYENAFSRSDSIGGVHGISDFLDIRLAFGEGFGTAFGCMMMDTNLYLDSMENAQATTAIFDDVEMGGAVQNPGWFNEASIYHILYDIYDSNDDEGDSLSFGFSPIHQVLINRQKNTEAFTSIFSFITALKEEFPGNNTLIDALTSHESIAPIRDMYGEGRVNRLTENANPLYANLTVGSSVNIVTNYSGISSSSNYVVPTSLSKRQNELGTYNFVKFEIPSKGVYRFDVKPLVSGASGDPDFMIYKGSSSIPIASSNNFGLSDSLSVELEAGVYRMSVIVYGQIGNSSYQITLN